MTPTRTRIPAATRNAEQREKHTNQTCGNDPFAIVARCRRVAIDGGLTATVTVDELLS